MGASGSASRFASQAALAAALITLLPAVTAAQEPVRSFDQLNTRLKVGDSVWVTDAQGREIEGKIRALSGSSLLLDAGGTPQDFEAARVGMITVQKKDSLKNGVLVGAAAGFGLGVASCALNSECIDDEAGAGITAVLGILGAASGAGIGALIDALVKGPKLVVYRTPGASGRARLSVAPFVTPRAKGVAVSFAF